MAIVAIAGVLMALLLPALSSAKEKSRRSVCGENMRQIVFALGMYGSDNRELLPAATDNRDDYHSIVLSSDTYSNMLAYLDNESNILYCPNLVYRTGTMGGYDPQIGFTIGYSYLAAAALPVTSKGPDIGWTGPLKTTEALEVIADANYWSKSPSQALTVAPHTSSGGTALALKATAGSSKTSSTSTAPAPGNSSRAMGAMGGNIGWLDSSVIWRPIRSMNQYPASQDGLANGNW